MFEIIKTQIGSSEVNAVSARDLHAKLECESKFADWVKRRIDKYDFIEGTDFTVLKNENGESSSFQQIEYFITIDMAKELSMVENNEAGKKARRYFIECEKKLKAETKPMTQLEMLAQSVLIQVEQEKRLSVTEQKVEEIATKIEHLEVDLRNGVPQGFISKSNAHKQYGKGLSKAIFEAALLEYKVTTQKYVHSENGHSTSTFAYKEDEIADTIEDFISNAEQATSAMCYSKLLNKRFGFIKGE
jgi:phage anti-repressor protein